MLIAIRRFCLKTPFMLCQYPCGLFSFTSSPSMQQDMKEYSFNHSAVFHHTRLLKKTLQKQGKQNQASCRIYTDNIDIHFNHRNGNYSYFKVLCTYIPLLATDKQSPIYCWSLTGIFMILWVPLISTATEGAQQTIACEC